MPELSYFDKRRIQMEYAVPLVRELQEVLGERVVLDALAEVNSRRRDRVATVQAVEPDQLAELLQVYAEGDALDYEIIASSSDQFDMDVHHCRYADMMEELGGREFGHLLICDADFTSARQLGLKLSRTQTCMQGAAFCDFRYRPDNQDPQDDGSPQ